MKPRQAPQFYLLVAGATLLGLALNFVGLDPIRALYWSAIGNGVAAAPLMALLMLMSTNRAIVREFKLPAYLQLIGWAATVIMCFASIAFLMSAIHG